MSKTLLGQKNICQIRPIFDQFDNHTSNNQIGLTFCPYFLTKNDEFEGNKFENIENLDLTT